MKALVIGDHCLDRDCVGEYAGWSRESESQPIFRVKDIQYKCGGAANLAANLSSLGVETFACGIWGNVADNQRMLLERAFRQANVDVTNMIEGSHTPSFEKYYFQSGRHVWRVDVPSVAIAQRDIYRLSATIEAALVDCQFVVVADYDETGQGVCQPDILDMISRSDVPTFGTSRERIGRFKDFDYLAMNEKELKTNHNTSHAGHYAFYGDFPELSDSAFGLLNDTGSKNIVVTLAGKGSSLIQKNGNVMHSAGHSITGLIDTCGCGDTFLAAFSKSILVGKSKQEAMDIANLAAHIAAKKLYGAHPVKFDELEQELQRKSVWIDSIPQDIPDNPLGVFEKLKTISNSTTESEYRNRNNHG